MQSSSASTTPAEICSVLSAGISRGFGLSTEIIGTSRLFREMSVSISMLIYSVSQAPLTATSATPRSRRARSPLSKRVIETIVKNDS